MNITTLVFDFGKVIFTNDNWYKVDKKKGIEFSKIYGISYEDIDKAWHTHWHALEKGYIAEDEFFMRILKDSGAKDLDTTKAKQNYRDTQAVIERMPELVRKLSKNYKIYAITNISKEWMEYKLKKFQMQDAFTKIISSAKYHMRKPDSEIFETAIKECHLSPEQCVFIDDNLQNVNAAKSFGFHALHFQGQKKLEKELKKYKIIF